MYDVFISYSSDNEAEVKKICKILDKNGFSYWFAPVNMRGNKDFTKEIPNAIRDSKAFLLLMSESAQNSKWVHRELGEADDYDVPIYTLFLEKCDLKEEFKFVLRYNQHYDFSQGINKQVNNFINDFKENSSKTKSKNEKKTELPTKSKSSKLGIFIGLACLVVVVAVAAMFLIFKGDPKDGEYVIWAPGFDMALSAEPINQHYHAGKIVSSNDGDLVDYGSDCVWKLTYKSDNTFTISRNGTNLGVEIGYNGIGLGGEYKADLWEMVKHNDGTCFVRNVESGDYLEWFTDKKNWVTHGNITDENRSQFVLSVDRVD